MAGVGAIDFKLALCRLRCRVTGPMSDDFTGSKQVMAC